MTTLRYKTDVSTLGNAYCPVLAPIELFTFNFHVKSSIVPMISYTVGVHSNHYTRNKYDDFHQYFHNFFFQVFIASK